MTSHNEKPFEYDSGEGLAHGVIFSSVYHIVSPLTIEVVCKRQWEWLGLGWSAVHAFRCCGHSGQSPHLVYTQVQAEGALVHLENNIQTK